MKDFIHGLYANPNFPLYLGIVIVLLLIAFFVIFFLGKKDKETLEETKKLDTVDNNTFSETTKPIALEVVNNQESVIDKPEININPVVESKPIEAPSVSQEVISFPNIPESNNSDVYTANHSQVTENIELPMNNQQNISYNTEDMTNNDIDDKTPLLNENVEPPISIPSVEQEKVPEDQNVESNNSTVVNDVFSSVYAPKKDPVLFDDTAEIELPRLK